MQLSQFHLPVILPNKASPELRFEQALRVNDVDVQAGTIRVDESSDQRTKGRIGLCKNTTAYRTVVLHDVEGRKAIQVLSQFMGSSPPDELIFHSRRKGALLQTTVLNQGLYPALKALGLPKGGLHAFRRGCNRRWELAKLNPAVIRQQMGHRSERMTAHYTGEIPLAGCGKIGKFCNAVTQDAS